MSVSETRKLGSKKTSMKMKISKNLGKNICV